MTKHFDAITTILVQAFNEGWDAARKIDAIADYFIPLMVGAVTLSPAERFPIMRDLQDELHEAIAEYGILADWEYLGRDSDGEKDYVLRNADTAWDIKISERVHKAFEALKVPA